MMGSDLDDEVNGRMEEEEDHYEEGGEETAVEEEDDVDEEEEEEEEGEGEGEFRFKDGISPFDVVDKYESLVGNKQNALEQCQRY